LALGILVLFLAGCFNPITVIPPKQNDTAIDPFTIDILIGKDTEDARSIAGPGPDRIKGNIRNIIQLIVVDNSGSIVAFDEVRRKNDAETEGVLRIDSITFGQTYYFLLLMGHWERNYDGENSGNYVYTEKPPTLLAAGLKEQHVTGSGKVTVTMWPVVVDTVFSTDTLTAQPVVNTGKPEAVSLYPLDWNVTWTIKRGLTGNGLTDLVRAQKIPSPSAGDDLLLRSTPQTLAREGTEAEEWEEAVLTGNTLTRSIEAYTSGFYRIGKTG
jgi:hypothetical protein